MQLPQNLLIYLCSPGFRGKNNNGTIPDQKWDLCSNFIYHMAGNFRGCKIFVKSRNKASELTFVILIFVTATRLNE